MGSPAVLNIQVKVVGVTYYPFVQLAIVLEGSIYTSGSGSVWQNTYLSGLRFAINDEEVVPHNSSVELTIITCGGTSPPLAEVELKPTIITEDNYHSIAQNLRNTPYPGGYAPISSGIRLTTDQIYNSDSFDADSRQIILVVTSGNPDCIWDENTGNGYGALYSTNTNQVQDDTINASEYFNSTINFDEESDELNTVTVAKTVELRESLFLNESIVMPPPGNIYDIDTPIVYPGWVFEVDSGKDEFQEAINIILKLLLNSINLRVNVQGPTTIDTNVKNNNVNIVLVPQ